MTALLNYVIARSGRSQLFTEETPAAGAQLVCEALFAQQHVL